ncbi:MAG: polymer-forming cytoskeletal protein [Alphaproteobacteria bacterium]|jgi:cytoskeletal protein CcmA (bactofilin family)
MFQKSERHVPPSKALSEEMRGMGPESTFISVDTKVGGSLTGIGEVHIDGEVNGDVYGHSVVVGPEGVVKGDISAEYADIAGTVHGRIEARTVSVARSAAVDGTISHNEIEIESGAKLESRRPWRPPSYFDKDPKG